jgi:hypothetical protein
MLMQTQLTRVKMTNHTETHEGQCSCGQVRYRMNSAPMIVHCCHCTWCQRQNGSAFAVNALIEADRVELLQGEVENTTLPSPSGSGQIYSRCPNCKVAVWSQYLRGTKGVEDIKYFIRVGTLDNPALLPPDVHIYTVSKQPWVVLPSDVPAVERFYNWTEIWSLESQEREEALKARIAAHLT